MTVYYLAWTTTHTGEATFTRTFSTPEDRAAFARCLGLSAVIRTWENIYPAA